MKNNSFIKLTLINFALVGILFGCKPSTSNPADTDGSTVFSCDSTPIDKGTRQFGMDILDVPSVGNYTDNLNHLKSLGGQFQTLHLNWSDIEGAGSGLTSGAFTDPFGALAALNALAISDGIKVTLRIHPVDVPGKFVPSDLTATRFNTATMKTRARAMLDYVFTQISPTHVTHLIIGNEIDGYDPGADTNFWDDYPDFLFDLNAYLQTTHPTVKLGFVITASGATDYTKVLPSSGGRLAPDVFDDTGWAAVVDLVGITYYPLDSSFQVKANSLVSTLFQSLVSFTAKPIHIEEVGFPSSTTTLGSENLQAEFYCEVFKAWDTHASRIPSLSILRMIDKSRSDAETVASTYGLSGNENFIEYIRSLGIRTNSNQSKHGFTIIQSELQKRGF